MAIGIAFHSEPIRSVAFGGISGVYARIGTPFQHPIRLIKVDNLTDQTLLISDNGIDDKFILAPNGFFLFDITTNAAQAQGWFIPEGTQFYVKDNGLAPSTGSVYVQACYATPQY